MSLIRQLVKKGVLDKKRAAALEYEVRASGQKEEEVILKKKLVSEDFLFGLKSETLKVLLKTISPDDVFLKVLETIPEESARYYRMIPLKQEGSRLEIGMVYPEDLHAREALDFLARQSNFTYTVYLITLSNFKDLLKKYRTLRREVVRALEELETEIATKKPQRKPIARTDIDRMVEEAPISKVVAVILRHAVDGSASDIHIEPGKEKVRVRFRLDGVLHASLFLPMRVLPAIVARIKILSNLKIDETRMPQDGRFSTKIEEREIDFRVSTFPTMLGEKVAIRILDPSQRKIDFEHLGITGRNRKVVEAALKKPYGMILAVGPTGSGKTTTLYAILGALNKEEVNIITLEDPVEYFIEGVSQSQVKPQIGYDFAVGLRHMVRQDPDVLMVGEIRDKETAALAIHAALTGHIMLSTLHTTNTLGVVPRLVDMEVQRFLIPPTLIIAIAQRLVRKLCSYCKKKVEPKPVVKKMLLHETAGLSSSMKKDLKLPEDLFIYGPSGCKRCHDSGYVGRIGIFEILEMTDKLADIIVQGPSENLIQKEAERQGMVTMKQDGIIKVLQGITSLEEVLRVAEQKEISITD